MFFGKPKTFASVFQKHVHSYALDAIDWRQGEKETPVSEESVQGFLDEVGKTKMELRLQLPWVIIAASTQKK
jgi:hypothetical protein